jgi:hypothetical protein
MSSRYEPPTERPCSVCGAPLTANASYCAECGASQGPSAAAPARRGEGRRWWIPVAIVAGGVGALLGGALLGGALNGGPSGEVADGSPSAAASASVDADLESVAPSGSEAPASSAGPSGPATADLIPNRAIAEVTTDALNLRSSASDGSETLMTLQPGRRLFIIGEPSDASDLRWYRVAPFDDVEGCEDGCGLIGYVATPVSDDEDAWIEPVEITCPSSPMTAQQIGVLDPFEALHCYGRTEIEITGTLDLPLHGPIDPYRYSPGWLTRDSLLFMRDAWWITYRPHPDAGLEPPERGDVVRATGHFEDPAATDCRATVDPDFFGGEIPDEFESSINPARVVLDCRTAFAWTDYEVIGFEDLGECCGAPPPSP